MEVARPGVMGEEHLPEAEAEVGNGYGHAQPDPEKHHGKAHDVDRNDDGANDFHGIQDIEEMAGGNGWLLVRGAIFAWGRARVNGRGRRSGTGSGLRVVADEVAEEAEAEFGEGFGLAEGEPEDDEEDNDDVQGEGAEGQDVHCGHNW